MSEGKSRQPQFGGARRDFLQAHANLPVYTSHVEFEDKRTARFSEIIHAVGHLYRESYFYADTQACTKNGCVADTRRRSVAIHAEGRDIQTARQVCQQSKRRIDDAEGTETNFFLQQTLPWKQSSTHRADLPFFLLVPILPPTPVPRSPWASSV